MGYCGTMSTHNEADGRIVYVGQSNLFHRSKKCAPRGAFPMTEKEAKSGHIGCGSCVPEDRR